MDSNTETAMSFHAQVVAEVVFEMFDIGVLLKQFTGHVGSGVAVKREKTPPLFGALCCGVHWDLGWATTAPTREVLVHMIALPGPADAPRCGGGAGYLATET